MKFQDFVLYASIYLEMFIWDNKILINFQSSVDAFQTNYCIGNSEITDFFITVVYLFEHHLTVKVIRRLCK